VRLGSLLVVNNAANLLTAPLFFLLTVVGINYLVANLLTLGLVFLLRFLFAERIWAPRPAAAAQS
jgi:hypothetical protein